MKEMPELHLIARVIVIGMIGVLCGLMGWLLGAIIGGNYAEQSIFNGLRGYEATGQIGFIVGTAAGLLAGLRILFAQKQKH